MSNDQSPMDAPADLPMSWEQLDRYLAGECPPDETARIARLLARHPEQATALHAYLRQGSGEAAPPLDDADSWTRMRTRIDIPSAVLSDTRPVAHRAGSVLAGRHTTRRWRSWPARLAVGVAVAAAGFAVLHFGVIGRTAGDRDHADRNGPFTRYATAVGQTATITLTDGSRITLAPQTTVSIPKSFGTTTRTVMLTGEAYFTVRPAAATPFLVRTGRLTTRVLGTAFDVRRYTGDTMTRVAVTTGKVALVIGRDRTVATLTAGRVAQATDSALAALATEDLSSSTAWMTGRLVFRGASTADVLAALSRWYGYQFKVVDSALVAQKVTAGLSTQSSADALATLKLVLDVDLAIDGNVITLRPRRRAEDTPAAQRRRRDALSTQTVEVGR